MVAAAKGHQLQNCIIALETVASELGVITRRSVTLWRVLRRHGHDRLSDFQ
jgi:hypothetical protein